MFEIIIEKMQKSHVEQIMEIESVSFGSHHWSKQSFLSEINNEFGCYFVALDKNTNNVVGYGGFWLILDEAHITTIAVKPELRKHKIGEIMLQHMIDEGYKKQAKWFTLEVRVGNTPAQNLYYKYGFENLGIRSKYYQDNNEDALIMWTQNIWDEQFKNDFKELKEKLTASNIIKISS